MLLTKTGYGRILVSGPKYQVSARRDEGGFGRRRSGLLPTRRLLISARSGCDEGRNVSTAMILAVVQGGWY